MINSRKEYKRYLEQDLILTDIKGKTLKNRIKDRRYKFYKSLRLTEYYTNVFGKKNIIGKLLRIRHLRLCDKYGWIIPINVFEEGLTIVHVGTIVVSGKAKIGKNCRLHVCTNIGSAYIEGGTKDGAPIIGDNVYIGPGAKIFGPITIGNNVAIGANAVVNKSFEEGDCTIAGIPAKVISKNTSEKYIIEKDDIRS